MTIAKKLIEVGLTCPCGGKIGWRKTLLDMSEWLKCGHCGAATDCVSDTVTVLTAWLILTGGPVPGVIEPPREEAYDGRYDDEWWLVDYEYGKWMQGVPLIWMLSPRIRNAETIRSWLESEYNEGTSG